MAYIAFIGDRTAPTGLAPVRRMRPLLGTGEVPEALRAAARMRVLYTETDSKEKAIRRHASSLND